MTQTRTKIALLALIAATLLVPESPANALDYPESGTAAYAGEELYYSLEFFGAQMARGALVIGDLVEEEGSSYLPIFGLAQTEGVAAMVYPMHDTGNTYIDPDSGLPIWSEKTLEERGELRRYEVDFDHDIYRSAITRLRDGRTSHYQRSMPSVTHDVLSWIYAIRQQDLTPGTVYVYFLYDGWKLSRVTATVQNDLEDILVGDEFISCRRISLLRDVMASSRSLPMVRDSVELPAAMWLNNTERYGEQVGDIFISNDDRRLPIMMLFENELITAIARLSEYRPPTLGY
jgi:hypothetical protein